MTDRPLDPTDRPAGRRAVVGGLVVAVLFGSIGLGLLALVIGARSGGAGAGAAATPTLDPATFAYAEVRPAQPLDLTDQDGEPFSLASLRGRPVLVFFGYTHCPDVCPQTVGTVNQALAAVGDGPRAVFASIDPERDDVAAMKSYLRYLPKAYIALTGTPQQVATNAAAWDIKYARIDQDSAAGYAMAHTAGIYLVDAQGMLRAHFPYDVSPDPIVAALRGLLAETPPPSDAPVTPAPSGAAPPASPTPGPSTPAPASPPGATVTILPEVISTTIWAGTGDPVILRAVDSTGTRLDGTTPLTVQLTTFDGTPQGALVTARPLLPEGESQAYFVAPLDIPGPGAWKLHLVSGGAAGEVAIQAQDPGATVPIGAPAPAVDTPTLADVGGVVRAVTTQPNPDLRLSQTSTADALAMGKPYVLVIDSARFKVSPECGRALTMIRYLLDRWGDQAVFVHLEPFVYQVITDEPVLSGSLADPPLNEHAKAFGLGPDPWPAVRMPWIFVVDAQGIVRAKYTGIVGSADIDVILTDILGKGRIGG